MLLGCGTSTVEIVLEHSCVCFDKNPQTFSGATFVTMSKKAGGGSAQDADELSERMGGMALVKSKTRTTDVVIHPFGTIKIAVWNPAAGGKKTSCNGNLILHLMYSLDTAFKSFMQGTAKGFEFQKCAKYMAALCTGGVVGLAVTWGQEKITGLIWTAINYFVDVASLVTTALKHTIQLMAIAIESFIRHHHVTRVSKDAGYIECIWAWLTNVWTAGRDAVKSLFCLTKRCSACHCLGHNIQNCPSHEFGPGWNRFNLQFVQANKKVASQVDQVVDEFSTKYRPALKIDDPGKFFQVDSNVAFRDRWSVSAQGEYFHLDVIVPSYRYFKRNPVHRRWHFRFCEGNEGKWRKTW